MTGKKMYWLKLRSDYFDSLKMKKLRQMAGGAVFMLIYLKMQLLALKADGIIVFEKIESSFAKELALQLDEKVEDVEMTLLYLQKVKLIEVNEECDQYFLPEVVENTGKESESAARVRKHRGNLKALQCNTAVTDGNALVTGGNKSVTTEIEKREKSSERDTRYQCVEAEEEEEAAVTESYYLGNVKPSEFIAQATGSNRS